MNDKVIISQTNNGDEIVTFTPANIESTLKYIKQHAIKSIILDLIEDETYQDFTFLERLNIDLLSIYNSKININNFPTMLSVKKLILSENNKSILNWSKFPGVEECFIYWGLKIVGISKNLKKLRICSFNTKSKSLSELWFAPNLEFLELNKTNIQNLTGIEAFTFLSKLDIYYASKLTCIEALDYLKSLESLKLNNIKKIESYNPLKSLNNLRELYLEKSKDIPSILFINQLLQMNLLCINGTNVIDGDLSPCVNIGYTWITPHKKHYTHKDNDFAKNPIYWDRKLRFKL